MKKFSRRNAMVLGLGMALTPLTFADQGLSRGGFPGHFPSPGRECFEDVVEEAQELGQSLRNVVYVASRLEMRGATEFAAARAGREVALFAQAMNRSCNQMQLRMGFHRVGQAVAQVKAAFRQSRRLQTQREAIRAVKDMDEEFDDLADEVREATRFPGRY